MYTVEAKPERARSRTASRTRRPTCATIQDWIIKPQLRTVPGVTEVNTIGGFEKQFHVAARSGAAAGLRADASAT